jgi:hypothetical protein
MKPFDLSPWVVDWNPVPCERFETLDSHQSTWVVQLWQSLTRNTRLKLGRKTYLIVAGLEDALQLLSFLEMHKSKRTVLLAHHSP